MASKQAVAKIEQGYVAKAIPKTCGNCQSLTSKKEPSPWNKSCIIESEVRCGIGGFAVKKMGSCNEFKIKVGE